MSAASEATDTKPIVDALIGKSICITLGTAMNSQMALRSLASCRLRAPISFRVAKVIQACEPNIELCNGQRNALLEKYGKLSEDKTQYTFELIENAQECEKEFAELLKTEIILAVTPIRIAELGDVEIAGGDLNALAWLITE